MFAVLTSESINYYKLSATRLFLAVGFNFMLTLERIFKLLVKCFFFFKITMVSVILYYDSDETTEMSFTFT